MTMLAVFLITCFPVSIGRVRYESTEVDGRNSVIRSENEVAAHKCEGFPIESSLWDIKASTCPIFSGAVFVSIRVSGCPGVLAKICKLVSLKSSARREEGASLASTIKFTVI